MSKHGLISYKHESNSKCEICIQSKMTKKPFPRTERTTQMLELVHSDICEFNGMLTRGDSRYFIIFIDDYSRYTYVYLMRHKSQALIYLKVL